MHTEGDLPPCIQCFYLTTGTESSNFLLSFAYKSLFPLRLNHLPVHTIQLQQRRKKKNNFLRKTKLNTQAVTSQTQEANTNGPIPQPHPLSETNL